MRAADTILTEQVRVVSFGIFPLPCANAVGREGTHPDPAKKASVEGAMTSAAERKNNLITRMITPTTRDDAGADMWKYSVYDLQDASVIRACTSIYFDLCVGQSCCATYITPSRC